MKGWILIIANKGYRSGCRFLPILLYFKVKSKDTKKPKWIYVMGCVGTFIYFAGFTFKILITCPWPKF
jgi:hypothetical protein